MKSSVNGNIATKSLAIIQSTWPSNYDRNSRSDGKSVSLQIQQDQSKRMHCGLIIVDALLKPGFLPLLSLLSNVAWGED